MMKAFRIRLRDFGSDTTGSMAVETVLIFPLLLWFYLSTFTFFDGYRAQSTNIKAAYTIADAMSREQNIDAAYLNTMSNLLNYMNGSSHATRLRVTVATRNKNNGKLMVQWSCAYGGIGNSFRPHNHTRLRELEDQIPPSPRPNELIVVETFIDHNPPFSAQLFDNEVPEGGMIDQGMPNGFMIGLQPTTLSNLVVIRPREAQLKRDGGCT